MDVCMHVTVVLLSDSPIRAQPGSANYESTVLYVMNMGQKSVQIGLSVRLVFSISEGVPKPLTG
jgi:hypothetical protein